MEHTSEQQSLLVLQKKLPMLVTMAVAIVLCCAVVLNFTRAWYSNNLDASAEGMQIISESPDVDFELIIYRQGVEVYNSTKDDYIRDENGNIMYEKDENGNDILDKPLRDETPWIGLLPGEEYIFLLRIDRTASGVGEQIDLNIGFLDLFGYDIGTTWDVIMNGDEADGILENYALQTLTIPKNKLLISKGDVAYANAKDENGEDIAGLYNITITGAQSTLATLSLPADLAESASVKNYSAKTLTITNVSATPSNDTITEFTVTANTTISTASGYTTMDVFQVGYFGGTPVAGSFYDPLEIIPLYKTNADGEQIFDEDGDPIPNLTQKNANGEQILGEDGKPIPMDANDDGNPRTFSDMQTLYSAVIANQTSNVTGANGWKLNYKSANDFMAGVKNEQLNYCLYDHPWTDTTDNVSVVIPFGIKILNSEQYMAPNTPIIFSVADLSNISIGVAGIYINALPLKNGS